MKLLKVSNVAQDDHALGKEDLDSLNKISAVGGPIITRVKFFSQATVPRAQYSKPHENQTEGHSAHPKNMTTFSTIPRHWVSTDRDIF